MLRQAYDAGVEAAFAKFAATIKSNDRMPPRTTANVNGLMNEIRAWDSPHRDQALSFAERVSPEGLFEILHSMRRWYSGQTMARRLLSHRDSLRNVMNLEPANATGAYRGFKVPTGHPLASVAVGDRVKLPVSRNEGFSSWSTAEEPTNRFSGGGRGNVGLIVKLLDDQKIVPVLAPPEHTAEWFNALYEHVIGRSFRPKEKEYLISSPAVDAEVVRVKR